MRVPIVASSALALLAAAIAGPASGQSVLLRMNPDEGLVSEYVMSMEMHMDMPMMSSDEPFMISTIYTTQTVVGVEGEVVEYTIVTDSAKIETPAMPMMQSQMPDQTGQIQTMKMDTRGRIVSMEMEGMSAEVQQVMGQMSGMGMELPENEVSPGDTWTARIDFAPGIPGGGEMSTQVEMTYTLVEVSSAGGMQFATISFEGPIVMSGEGGGVGMEASGTSSGTLVFDVTNGRLASSDMALAMDLTAAGMPMSMDLTMTMTLIN